MKKVIYSFVSIGLFTLSTLYAKPGKSPIILTGETASKQYPGTELVRIKEYSKIPNFVRFAKGYEIELTQVESWLGQYTQNHEGVSLQLIRQEQDKLGYTHYRYQQLAKGFPLAGTYYVVHVKNGQVVSMNGDLLADLTSLNEHVILTETEALQKALSSINAEIYKWEIPSEEAHLKITQDDENATYFPKGELVVLNGNMTFDGPQELRVTYKFNIYAHKPFGRQDIYIDAQDGRVIFSENKIQHVDVPGTAQTVYSGSQTIMTEQSGGSYRLRETGRGNGIETYNLMNSEYYGSAVDFTDTDNNWNNVNPQLDEYATDGHWGAEMTYDYYMIKHNRNSIDDNGFKLLSYLHFNSPYDNPNYPNGFVNAFWDGNRMTYGDGDINQGYTPLTSIDIAGHEITHGLVEFTAGLIYNCESGALNESFADIFGVTIDFYARPSQANYLMGDEISGGNPFRSMQNPNAHSDPDTYDGTYWVPCGGPDHGGVHTNSGVQNFWYYLMVNGGSGTNDNGDAYTVTGIGMDNAADIAFRNLTVYLGPNSQYSDARFYAVQSATDLFGACSPELETTENAWYAVGVGGPSNGGSANFQASQTNGCTLPFTANFSTASGSTSYDWDFGDGGSSTLQNPSHDYTQTGTFTVVLTVSGGTCGDDTVTKVSYITVDTAGGCPVILPPGGTAPTQYACTGTIVDDGGLGGDYTENTQHTYITIAPTGATSIDFDFLSFALEVSTGCIWDYIEIFDGPTTSSPSLGKWCGNNPPSGTVSSTTGIVLIDFLSDQLDVAAGFELKWTCQTGGTAGIPVANFSTSSTNICTGSSVTFTNTSTNATSYQWNMPGATPSTSTLTNPTVTYSTAGVYSVTLTAVNGSNTDVEVKSNLVTVVQGPQANFSSTSSGLTANFTDMSVGATTWVWTFGDGGSSILQNPSHTYSSNGTYQVCLTADNANCPAQNYCTNVTVNASSSGVPQAAHSVSSNNLCEGDTVHFYNQSTGSPTAFQWSFPGGNPASSTAANPTVIYATSGIYNVQLIVSNSYGTDTVLSTSYVNVYDHPNADFTHISNALTVNFIDQSINATGFLWNFGDGGTSVLSSPIHAYSTPGTYLVCLTAINPSCPADVKCDSIWVAPTAINSLTQDYYMQIFPNPANEVLNLKIKSDKLMDYSIRMTDLLGKVIMVKSLTQSTSVHEMIDVKTLSSGTYMLFINDTPHKIVVE